MGKAQAAYHRMINEQGRVNGRTIRLLSRDDGYSPPKAVEQVRDLVEDEDVLACVGQLGTPQALAVRRYLNGRRVPQLLTLSGSSAYTRIPLLLPGLSLRMSATGYRPIKELRMIRFDGTSFVTLDDTVR